MPNLGGGLGKYTLLRFGSFFFSKHLLILHCKISSREKIFAKITAKCGRVELGLYFHLF